MINLVPVETPRISILDRAGRVSRLELIDSDDTWKLIDLWLNGKSASTQKTYRRDVEWFLAYIGDRGLQLVTLEDLHGYKSALCDRGLAWNTIRKKLMAVKSLLAFGHRIGVLTVDCGKAFDLKPAEATLHKKILSEGDTLRMVHGYRGSLRDQLMLLILYATGVRVSELCSMTWDSWVELSDGRATVTVQGKGDKVRSVSVSADIWGKLKQLKGDSSSSAPVFASRSGRHLTRVQVNRVVTRAKDQAGIDRNVSPHWLRHAHATHATHKGAPVALIQKTLGHADANTTMQYSHIAAGQSSGDYLSL